MIFKVQLCYNRKVGLGVRAVTNIPKDTKILFYYGDVWNTKEAKELHISKQTHIMTIPGTGCSIDGAYDILFPDTNPNMNKIYDAPCNLMSLTNSSKNYKEANCKAIIVNDAREYSNGLSLSHTAWLTTTHDIEPYEELIWNYSYKIKE